MSALANDVKKCHRILSPSHGTLWHFFLFISVKVLKILIFYQNRISLERHSYVVTLRIGGECNSCAPRSDMSGFQYSKFPKWQKYKEKLFTGFPPWAPLVIRSMFNHRNISRWYVLRVKSHKTQYKNQFDRIQFSGSKGFFFCLVWIFFSLCATRDCAWSDEMWCVLRHRVYDKYIRKVFW